MHNYSFYLSPFFVNLGSKIINFLLTNGKIFDIMEISFYFILNINNIIIDSKEQ